MKKVTVTGMKCQGCVDTVTEKLSSVVSNVKVDLDSNSATFDGNASVSDLNAALADTSYNIAE
ncbi:heavy-metal-associated domain-containing protein [Loigolactobacillus zhaoyuanensis]|uniref:Heavy-metal-associated domain-containing protein n=1 Tax=Loigolactobacillus zhaoyuanensis TaxID=2486017 RepID=A0ABW8UHC6_9LACO|nr:heavy metal-associated domain-containing protein [Loigolactobacillus zhaoyuanensis]